MVLKHNVVWQICSDCGALLYPPTEVSVIGEEDYEEVYEAPEPDKTITDEELAKINKDRETPLTKQEWIEGYRLWAQAFRDEVRAKAQARHDALVKGAPKVKGLRIDEEAKSFKVVGKRWEAIYESTEKGWELHCPNCDTMTLKWELAKTAVQDKEN